MTSKPGKKGYAALIKLAQSTVEKPNKSINKQYVKQETSNQSEARSAARPGSRRGQLAERGLKPDDRAREKKSFDASRPSSRAKLPTDAEKAPVRHITADAEHEGQRLDNYLIRELKGAPKSLVYRILRSGEVRVDGKRAKPDHRITAGAVIRIPPLRLGERVAYVPSDDRIAWIADCILEEDRELIVLNKPSGLASHGGSGLSFGAIEAMRAIKPNERLELVHRLDRDTSGVLLISKKRTALKFLQTAMLGGQITKRYLALMRGNPKKDKFDVKAALLKNELSSGERIVKVDDEGKPSITHFKVLERFSNCCLVEATLGTGRTHQIRVHAQTIGHNLAGCDKYGDEAFNADMRALGLNRLFLHAAHIGWKSADGNRSYDAALPVELERVVTILRKAQT
jgi:23S rRNA pseudouridine955/2504/2580 synthase